MLISERTIWGERFDRKIDDIFDILDEVTECIVAATAVMIESHEKQRMVQTVTSDLEAYGSVLQGQHHIFKYTRNDNKKAQSFYQSALERDGGYARAAAALSRTLNIDWRYSWAEDPLQCPGTGVDTGATINRIGPYRCAWIW